MHAFHSDPILDNEIPRGLETHGFARRLPIADMGDPHILKIGEAFDLPVRPVFRRNWKVVRHGGSVYARI